LILFNILICSNAADGLTFGRLVATLPPVIIVNNLLMKFVMISAGGDAASSGFRDILIADLMLMHQ